MTMLDEARWKLRAHSLIRDLAVVLADVNELVAAKSPVIRKLDCDVFLRVATKLKLAKRWLDEQDYDNDKPKRPVRRRSRRV